MDGERNPQPARTERGRELGGYVLGDQLGAGGMGVVYRAVDADGHDVALKLLHPHIAADPEARARLRREVATLQRVRGAGVARVLDAETDLDDAFIVTELIDGLPLNESVQEDGIFADQELADFSDDMFRALIAIHAVGVVHRDLKPSNVMVTDNGPVLIDFGIAHAADESRITQTGMVMGTPGYLAPEVLSGATSSPDSDWWALAAVLLFAATGRPAFGRGSLDVILGRVTSGGCDVDGLSPTLGEIFRQMLLPEPSRRTAPADFLQSLKDYAAAIELDDVDATAPGETVESGPTSGDRRTRLQRAITPALLAQENLAAGATTVISPHDTDPLTRAEGGTSGTRALTPDPRTEMMGEQLTQTRAFGAGDVHSGDEGGEVESIENLTEVPRPPSITPGMAPQEIAAPSRHDGVAVESLPGRVHPGAVTPPGQPTPTQLQPSLPQWRATPQRPNGPISPYGSAAPNGLAPGATQVGGSGAGATYPGAPYLGVPPGGNNAGPGVGVAPPPIVTPTATGMVLALAGATIGFGIYYPAVAMAVLAVVLLIAQAARLAGRTGERMWSEKGKRPSGMRIALGWPWYLVRAVIPTFLSWGITALAAVLVIGGVEFVVAIAMERDISAFGHTAARWPLQARGGLAAGLALASLLAWCGPFGARQREGVARISRNIIPSSVVRNVISGVLVVMAAMLIIIALVGPGVPNWLPFTWQ